MDFEHKLNELTNHAEDAFSCLGDLRDDAANCEDHISNVEEKANEILKDYKAYREKNESLKAHMLEFLSIIVNVKNHRVVYEYNEYVPKTEWDKPIAHVEKLAAKLYEELQNE